MNVLHEIGNHKAYCATFGITEEDLENTPEATATIAYGAYIIDIGLQGTLSSRYSLLKSEFIIFDNYRRYDEIDNGAHGVSSWLRRSWFMVKKK